MCHVDRLSGEQRVVFEALPYTARKRLLRILEGGGIESKAKPVQAVFERFIESKHLLKVTEAMDIQEEALALRPLSA